MKSRKFLSLAFCFLASGVHSARGAGDSRQDVHDRDALWRIVSHCLPDEYAADYCALCPAPLARYLASCIDSSGQDPVAVCRETSEVWAQTKDYVAVRDRSMCGCPPGYVHGLALPLRKVTGIEDPSKPDGIWRFAWNSARGKIGAEFSILLAVNSPRWRSQDQLHVHLARLDDATRRRIRDGRHVRVEDLSRVWAAAARLAGAEGLPADGYGVALIRDPENGGFLIAALTGGIERGFAALSCGRGR